MKRATLLAFALVFAFSHAGNGLASTKCQGPFDPACRGNVVGDQIAGDFHGLIMVKGQPDVLDLAARSGTKTGCGDCEWTLVFACVNDNPGNTGGQTPCAGVVGAGKCRPGQLLFRLYLSTDAEKDRLVDEICLATTQDVVPVGDIAAADVDKYLRDVHPPDLDLTVQPPGGALAGLPAYFVVRPPTSLKPQPFGGPEVTETITIAPRHYSWTWGDGSPVTKTDDAGAPYPTGTLTHTYTTSARVDGELTTQWSATYTIAVAGRVFGPYDATGGLVAHTQSFAVTVDSAHSHLVSH
jgi:hypothetical protein